MAANCMDLNETDVVAGFSVLSYLWQLNHVILAPLYAKCKQIVLCTTQESEEIEYVSKLVSRYKVSQFSSSPFALSYILKLKIENHPVDFSSLRQCCCAGEKMNQYLVDNWSSVFPSCVLNNIYGCSELGLIAVNEQFCPEWTAKLVDDDMCEIKEGIGKLALQGPAGCMYWNRPKEQAAMVKDGWNIMGDMWLRTEAKFKFQGRIAENDGTVTIASVKIHVARLEALLLAHPMIEDAAVEGIFSEEAQTKILVFFVVAKQKLVIEKEELQRELFDEISTYVERSLSPDYWPAKIKYFVKLPRGPTGKLLRTELM